MPPVWIVVLTLNNYADTFECLQSVRALTYPAVRAVVVDNGSTDKTPERVRFDFPEVDVLENGINLGVPAGYNVGFVHALQNGAQYVLMLNNDTRLDSSILDHLVAAAQMAGCGIAVPVAYYYNQPDKVWSAGARYRRFPPASIMETRLHRLAQGYFSLDYAIGCCILITREAFERVGLLDDMIFFMWEDLDFSERVRQAGLTILQVPDAKVWHKVSRTSNPESTIFWEQHGRSGAIFYRRHSRTPMRSIIVHLTYFALREFVVKGRWRFLRPFLRGIAAGCRCPLDDVPRWSARSLSATQ